ncbi:hypothetical protein FX982_02862 [Pseudomonas graminis]|uniref:Uncharacterized protein n=1 Tax=Pseudomonas graminis TaxID=158627 RepID=A0A6M8MLJ1_9PSED|nr:hypothetical protein FX982_02862 [Pseudomonas graminis]
MVPTLRVGTQPKTLRVKLDAERQTMHSHAERGNDHPLCQLNFGALIVSTKSGDDHRRCNG